MIHNHWLRIIKHASQPLDDLREEYYRVNLSAVDGDLPADLPFSGVKHVARDKAAATVTIHNPDRVELEREVAQLGCPADIRHLDFEEIYRLVVTGK